MSSDISITLKSDVAYTDIDPDDLAQTAHDAAALVAASLAQVTAGAQTQVTISPWRRGGNHSGYITRIAIHLDEKGWSSACMDGVDPLAHMESVVCPPLVELLGSFSVEDVTGGQTTP